MPLGAFQIFAGHISVDSCFGCPDDGSGLSQSAAYGDSVLIDFLMVKCQPLQAVVFQTEGIGRNATLLFQCLQAFEKGQDWLGKVTAQGAFIIGEYLCL